MGLDKNTKEIIKFVRKMQTTDRYKKGIYKVVGSSKVKVDNSRVLGIDNSK